MAVDLTDHPKLTPPAPSGVLRAVRWGGFVAAVAGVMMLVLWWPDYPQPLNWVLRAFYGLVVVTAVGAVGFRAVRSWRLRIAIGILAGAAYGSLAVDHLRLWWLGLVTTSFSSGLFLALALIDLAFAVILLAWLWLVHLDQQIPRERDHELPSLAGLGPLRGAWARPRRRGTRIWRTAVAVAVAGLLISPVAVAQHWPRTSTEIAEINPIAEPVPSEGSPVWHRDTPSLLGITAGALGPIILTAEGVECLSPDDGSTLWRWHRQGARYQSVDDTSIGVVDPVLVTSPDKQYVAIRMKGPLDTLWPEGPSYQIRGDSWTVVLETATGRPVAEHISSYRAQLQLTNQAVLDGGIAYSLRDGSQLWATEPADATGYTGTAGEHTFILAGKNSQDLTASIIPDDDPRSPTPIGQLARDPNTYQLVVEAGWAVRYSEKVTIEKGVVSSQAAAAVPVDDLAAADSPRAVPLGEIGGINALASRSSGTLALNPAYPDGSNPTVDASLPQVGQVFDPSSGQVLTPDDGSLATATIGRTDTDVVVTYRDGRKLTIPLPQAATAIPESPRQLGDWTLQQRRAISLLSTPDITVAILGEGEGTLLLGYR